ncbi:MAG: AsmA-like C-terminal region-containing protein, partial [Rhizobiaceae bacterium]
VDIQVGPKGKPVIRATGNIRDILAFEGIEMNGQLQADADLILKSLSPEKVAEFGSVKGEFTFSDASGELAITQFDGYSFGSELWSLDSSLSVRNVKTLSDLKFKFDLGVADGARFLEALQLEPVDTGRLDFNARISGESLDMKINAAAGINKSRLDASLSNETTDENQIVRGEMKSAEIHIDDLRDVVRAAVQLQSMFSAGNAKKPEGEIQPLVIETEDKPETEADKKPEVLPLVIEEEEEGDGELFTSKNLLRRLDLEFGINIDKIVGQEGVSGLNSDLTVKSGKLEFGPLKASYGGGHFDVAGSMDLMESTDILQVAGSTGGWDIGEILDSVGLGIDAYGKLTGNFDVTGNITSLKSFLNTAEGNATIRMANGRVATSLVELAGLGIFNWLFSEELRQGYTDIVCINAPLRLSGGGASSNTIVAETKSVQLVVEGSANWRNDTIAIRAEPRPVGRPLDRSAFPFEVNGQLTNPDFNLKPGSAPAEAGGWSLVTPETNTDRVPCVPDDRQ